MTEENKPANAQEGLPPPATPPPSAQAIIERAKPTASEPATELSAWDRRFCAVGGRIAAAIILLIMFASAGLIGWISVRLIRIVWNDYVH